ncbi:MAG: PKD domain-containing protein [Cyclobacteriaceae bacterium]
MDLLSNVMRVAIRETVPALCRFFFSIIILFLGTYGSVSAQNFSGHNWYFGNSNQGIRFSRSDNSATLVSNKANPFSTGGSAVASDPINGNLLFYSNGANIYDLTHTVMPNGSGLTANTAGNQPVAIAKVPGSPTQYYVFTNTTTLTTGGSIAYSIVDMALFGNATFPTPAIGDVVSKNTPIGGLTNRSEGMIVVQHTNGRDFWLITHESGAPNYAVTLFNNSGIGPAATNTFTLGLIDYAANLSYHPSSGRMAVSPHEPNRDIEVVNFNPATGGLTFNQRIFNTAVTSALNPAIYDTEWNNNGQYLYISRTGEGGVQGDVVQFDLTNPATTLASVLPQPNTIFRSYGLQMAPDSAIYHLYQATNGGPFLLGTITNLDTVASLVAYDPSAFVSSSNFNGTQFSSFAPKDSINFTVTFTTDGTCSNTPISFFPTVVPAADSLIWSFGDGQFANEWSPVHTYDQGGSVLVQVIAFLNGDTARSSQPLNITQFDLQLTLVQDTTACVCELPVNAPVCPSITPFEVSVQAQGGTPQYQWFGPGGLLAGQTTETLRPDSAGYYYVVGTVGGCSAYAGVNIKEYDSLDQRANIWYFGQNAGIDFNPLPDNPAVAIDGPLVTPAGTSVISDRNGQVIFSTDGFSIFNKLDQDITPPGGIGGENTASQSALIIPVPGDETLFYIFTTKEIYGSGTFELRYSLFDLKLNNGLGGLSEFNQLLFAKSTERITGNNNWLIAHEYGNNSFRAYRISSTGISNPIISSIGSDHNITSPENGQGYMKLGAQNRLAVALSTPGVSNVVEIFDFIDSSGAVTNFRTADLQSTTGQVYGVELSPAGNKLFATLKDANSEMFEFAFDTLGIPYLKQSVPQSGELGAIQIGPDGQLYVAINGSSSLGTFSAQEDTTALSPIAALQPFALAAGTTSNLGLPNFIQTISNPTQTPTFTFTGLCLGDSTQFTATGKDPAIDKFDWTFGDGQTAIDSGAQIAHLYAAPGTYTVTLRIYNKCETPVGTYTQQVIINDVPPDPSNAVVLCTGSALLDANPQDLPNFTYVWSTGDSTETITVNRQAVYTVTVTDALGCSTDGSILAADNRPQVDLGANTTICQNTPVAPLDAQNPGATYAWETNGAASGTGQTQSVNTAVFGIFEYKVQVTDPVTNCFVRDSVTYTINESPGFNVVTNSPIVCNSDTGEITLNFVTPATGLFSYFIAGPTGVPGNTDQPAGTTVITVPPNLDGGTYAITVTDQVSGCTTTSTTSINEDALTVGPVSQNTTCDPIALDVTVVATPGPLAFPLSYRIINNSSGAVVETATSPTATFTTDVQGIPSNNQQYVVEVTTDNGCTASSAIVTVNEDPTVPITLVSDPCQEPVTITVTGGDTWSWTGPGTITGANTPSISVAGIPQGPNTFNLSVSVTGAAFCALDTAITLNVNNNITAAFTQSDACADQVILTATPSGPYTYRWLRNGSPVLGGQQILVGLTDNGIQYSVDVVNTVSGCIFSSPAQIVNVSGDLQFALTATPPCEGQPFTLTATANQPGVTYEWALNGGVLSGQTSATLVETRGGMYEVTVTSSGGTCFLTQTFNVVPSPVTPGILPGSGIICPDPANPDPLTKEVLLDPGDEFTDYDWFRDGSSLGETSQTYTATTAGTYSVNLINVYGCPSTDETLLIEDCSPRITGPNAFRPTSSVQGAGEYTNRNFMLFTFFIDDQDFEVFIFNRWGEMIYHTNERDFRWNGGYNNSLGQPLPTGTYTYVVRYRSSYRPEQGILEKRGGVVLLR